MEQCAQCEIGFHGRCDPAECGCFCHEEQEPITPQELDAKMKQLRAKLMGPPKMTEVFKIKEAPIGAKPFQKTNFPRMGQAGQSLSKSIDQKSKAGEPYNVWQTKDNQILATPSQQTGNQPTLKANAIDGTWDPMDPKQQQNMQNQQAKSGPQPATSNNLMKGGGGTM